MYFAGTIAHGMDWRKAAGGFIHGFRYTAQASVSACTMQEKNRM